MLLLDDMYCMRATDVQPGDSLFFHYSGHGSQQPDPLGVEEDGMNEVILPGEQAKALYST